MRRPRHPASPTRAAASSVRQCRETEPTAAMIPRMDESTITRFISLLKEQECLWNSTAENYKSKEARKLALQKIAEDMEIPGFGVLDVKKKIKSLRGAYYKELRKMEEFHHRHMRSSVSENSGPLYQPRNPWFATMDSFLRPYILISRRKSQGADHRHSSRFVSDEQEVFGRYVASHLRRLTPEQSLRIQTEISALIIGVRLKNLKSVKVSKDQQQAHVEEQPQPEAVADSSPTTEVGK